RQPARFTCGLEPRGEELQVVGQAGRSQSLEAALVVERLDLLHGSARIAVEGADQRRVHARLERGVGAARFAEQVVGADGGRQQERDGERQPDEDRAAHQRYWLSVALFHASRAANRACPSGFSLAPSQVATL